VILPGRPLAVYSGAHGVNTASAARRISSVNDLSGNLNHTPSMTGVATKQGYHLNDWDGAPYMYFPRVLEDASSGTVVETYLNLPTSWARNASGTSGAVTLSCRNLSIFSVRSCYTSRIDQQYNIPIFGNDTFVGAFLEKYGGFHSDPLFTANDGNGAGDARWTGKVLGSGWSTLGLVATASGVTFYEESRTNSFASGVIPPNSAPGANPYMGAKQTSSGPPQGGNSMACKLWAIYDRSDFSSAELDDIFGTMNEIGGVSPTTLNIFCHGDSLTLGTATTFGRTYPAMLPLQRGWRVRASIGVSGHKFTDMTSNATTLIDPYITASQPNALLAWAGINDLNASVTIANVIVNATAYIAARRAVDPDIIIGLATTPPGFSNEATLNGMNNAWRQNFKTVCDADFLFDVTQFPTTGLPIMRATGASDLVYYNSDAVHPNALGTRMIAAGWADCLKRYLRNPNTSDVPYLLVN
jgi:lysophospholipase L1-like esterase